MSKYSRVYHVYALDSKHCNQLHNSRIYEDKRDAYDYANEIISETLSKGYILEEGYEGEEPYMSIDSSEDTIKYFENLNGDFIEIYIDDTMLW